MSALIISMTNNFKYHAWLVKRYIDISILFTCLKDARGKQIYIATQGNITYRIILLFFLNIIDTHVILYFIILVRSKA